MFTDSCFLIGLADRNDQYHGRAEEVMGEFRKRSLGFESFVLTDFMAVEVFHRLQDKVGYDRAKEYHRKVTLECKIYPVTRQTIDKAISAKLAPFVSARRASPPIGLADATNLVVMDSHNIRRIASFDGGYDRYSNVRRIHDGDSARNALDLLARFQRKR